MQENTNKQSDFKFKTELYSALHNNADWTGKGGIFGDYYDNNFGFVVFIKYLREIQNNIGRRIAFPERIDKNTDSTTINPQAFEDFIYEQAKDEEGNIDDKYRPLLRKINKMQELHRFTTSKLMYFAKIFYNMAGILDAKNDEEILGIYKKALQMAMPRVEGVEVKPATPQGKSSTAGETIAATEPALAGGKSSKSLQADMDGAPEQTAPEPALEPALETARKATLEVAQAGNPAEAATTEEDKADSTKLTVQADATPITTPTTTLEQTAPEAPAQPESQEKNIELKIREEGMVNRGQVTTEVTTKIHSDRKIDLELEGKLEGKTKAQEQGQEKEQFIKPRNERRVNMVVPQGGGFRQRKGKERVKERVSEDADPAMPDRRPAQQSTTESESRGGAKPARDLAQKLKRGAISTVLGGMGAALYTAGGDTADAASFSIVQSIIDIIT